MRESDCLELGDDLASSSVAVTLSDLQCRETSGSWALERVESGVATDRSHDLRVAVDRDAMESCAPIAVNCLNGCERRRSQNDGNDVAMALACRDVQSGPATVVRFVG